MQDNPFESPRYIGNAPLQPEPGQDPRKFGMARQVPIVAVIMIVQGVLVLLAGAGLMVFAFWMPDTMREAFNKQGNQPQPINPDTMVRWMFIGYLALGGFIAAIGMLQIVAGIRNYSYRGRVLGIVAMVSGLVSAFTCYCLPTALGLLIYGMIVYLSKEGEQAFRWQEALDNGG